jgi:AcrR family transcriptional regulator
VTERTNRRDVILDAASDLFFEQGFTATSIRQIAEAVGVTEAALYYHFKDGKRELLQAVLERKIPDMVTELEELEGATSLDDMMERFGHSMIRLAQRAWRTNMLRWLIAEFDKFTEAEREIVREKQMMLQSYLVGHIKRFVPAQSDAERLAWFLLCAMIGYEQFFMGLGHSQHADFPLEQMNAMLRQMVTCTPWDAEPDTTEGSS